MEGWRKALNLDPLPPLQASENEALLYFVRRDLLGEGVEPIEVLWELPEVVKILNKQQKGGSWKYPGGKKDIRSQQDYNQLQTYKVLMNLVEKYIYKTWWNTISIHLQKNTIKKKL